MTKNYKVKFKRELVGKKRYWGFDGNAGPQSWNETVNLILERGIAEVEYIQHYDKMPVNYKRLDGKEMLFLWQAVAKTEIPTQK